MQKRKYGLNGEILEGLKSKIIDFLCNRDYTVTSNQIRIITERMNKIITLYVDNLMEQGIGKMCCRADNIVIDEQFVEFKNGIPVNLKRDKLKLILSQLIHELFHAASNENGNAGIRKTLMIEKNKLRIIDEQQYLAAIVNGLEQKKSYKTDFGLDEGITQMMTGKVNNYVVSPLSDGYADIKKFAKILDCTIGERSIYNSYFFKTNDLDTECNELAKDNSFFSTFNRILDNFDQAHLMTIKRYLNQHSKNIYADFKNQIKPLLIKYFTANIIIPKIKQLPFNKRREYIKNVLDCVKEDNEFYTQLSNCIISMYKMEEDKLEETKKDVLKSLNMIMSIMNSYTKCIMSDELLKILLSTYNNQLALMPSALSDKRYLLPKDSLIEEDLLSHNFEKKEDASEAMRLSTLVEVLLKKINNNEVPIHFRENQNPITRKEKFAKIKVEARKRGYLILNSISECENSNEIKLQVVQIRDNGNPISYEDLAIISKRYSVKTIQDEILGERNIIVDNMTGNEVDNPEIQKITYFTEVCKNGGLTFDSKNDKLRAFYNALSDFIIEQLKKDGSIDITEFYKKFKVSKDLEVEMFNSNYNIAVIENFYRLTEENYPLETELPETAFEYVNGIKMETIEQKHLFQKVAKTISPRDIIGATRKYTQDRPGIISSKVSNVSGFFEKAISRNGGKRNNKKGIIDE